MASTFPGAIDSFTDPLSGSALNSPSHSSQHADLNNAVNKIENYMGLVKVIPTGATNGTVGATGNVTIGNAVSSVTVSGAFSSLYDNYKIMISGGVGSTLSTLWLSLGASATGYSSGLFYVAYGATAAQAASDNGSVAFTYAGYATTGFLSFNLDVINPFLAKPTVFGPTNWAAGTVAGTSTGIHNISTSYSAFTITAASGTITGGTIRVYGYRN